MAARLLAVLALASTLVAPALADTPMEAAVKATYLYKIAPFVTWPAGALGGAEEPFVLCIQGADPFGQVVDRAVAGQRVGPHPIVVRRVGQFEKGDRCHMAYLGGSRSQSPAEGLAALEGAPVLTVTDASHGSRKGVVHLMLDSGRVRFAVDAGQAAADGLVVSSKLLALAVEVTR